MLFLNYCIFSGNAEALVRCGGKLWHLLIAYFLGSMCAKHYENPTMFSRVTAKNARDVFLRHTVYIRNSSGPNTVPCGIPLSTSNHSHNVPLTLTFCCLLVRIAVIHCTTFSSMLYVHLHHTGTLDSTCSVFFWPLQLQEQ